MPTAAVRICRFHQRDILPPIPIEVGYVFLRVLRRIVVCGWDNIPVQLTTKRLVIVDNSGNEVVTLGQHQDPQKPSTQLLFTSPDKKATYSLQVGTATNSNEGGFVLVDATSNVLGSGNIQSETSQYTLRVLSAATASSSAYYVYPKTGQGVEHISTVHADSSNTGVLTCANGLLAPTTVIISTSATT